MSSVPSITLHAGPRPYVAPVSIFSRGLIPESAHMGYDFWRSEATAAGWSNDVQRRLGVDEAVTHACQRVADSFVSIHSDVRTRRKSSVVIVVARLRVNTAASVSVYIRTCTVPLSLHARMRQLSMVRKRLYEARNATVLYFFGGKNAVGLTPINLCMFLALVFEACIR